MTDDEKLIEDLYPCRSWCRTVRYGVGHACTCRPEERERARRLAAAVREAVLKRVRGCRECHGTGTRIRLTNIDPPKCERCHGRGVVEGET